jgi:hypothetical protein
MKPAVPAYDPKIAQLLSLANQHARVGNIIAVKTILEEIAAIRRGRTPWGPDLPQRLEPLRVDRRYY